MDQFSHRVYLSRRYVLGCGSCQSGITTYHDSPLTLALGTPEPPYQEGQDLSYFATCSKSSHSRSHPSSSLRLLFGPYLYFIDPTAPHKHGQATPKMVIADIIAVTIFDLADYFLLPELRRQMGARFANDMYLWGCGWHDAWKQQQQTRMDTLFELVRDLYTRDLNSPASKEFRPPVLNHLRGVQTGGEIPTTALIDLIDEFPALGADLFKASLGRAEALLHAEEDFDAEEEM